MKRIKSFLLACIMIISALSINVIAAVPETVQPLWDNTYDVILAHTRIGSTSHVNVDITVERGSTIMNAEVSLLKMATTGTVLVKRWSNPAWTADAAGTHNFYATYSPVESGVVYQLVFQCEVWRNGVCDEIGFYKNVQY